MGDFPKAQEFAAGLRGSQLDAGLDEEIRLHVELRAEKLRAQGMGAAEAYDAAGRQFGNTSRIKETSREMWTWRWIEEFGADLRYAWRGLLRSPAFAAVAVLTLALGLGANAAIFSLVDAVMLKPLPYDHPEQLMVVNEKTPKGMRITTSAATFADWKSACKSMWLFASSGNWLTMTGEGEPQKVQASIVTTDYFAGLGSTVASGRNFLPEESQPGREHVILATHKFWQSALAGDPLILGRRIILDGTPYTVVGVLDSRYDRHVADVWIPATFSTAGSATRDFRYISVYGRLKPDVTIESARAEMQTIAARIAQDNPKTNRGWSADVMRLSDRVGGSDLRQSLYILLGAVAAVLLIGCVNLANLLLARSAAREREVQMRVALGAGKARLVRQFLTESLLLSLLGATVGMLLGEVLLNVLKNAMPNGTLPWQADPKLDLRVLGYMLALAVAAGMLFGLVPAIAAWHKDAVGLREDSRASTGGMRRQRIRSILIVSEVALAFVLVATAGVLIHSFERLTNVGLGFETENLLSIQLPRSMGGRDTDGARLAAMVHRMSDEVAGIPGVRDAAIATATVLEGWGFGVNFELVGRPAPDPSNRISGGFNAITSSYFQTIGLKLRKGRLLKESDSMASPRVLVINESFAKRYFPDSEPIGQYIAYNQIVTGKREIGPRTVWEIVGVVSDEVVDREREDHSLGYVTFDQNPLVGFGLVVRGQGDPRTLVKSIQAALTRVDPNQAITNVKLAEEIKSESTGPARLRTLILSGFAGLALLLAAVGIYGVVAYSVTQRTRELGIRAALGASRGSLLGLALGGSVKLAAAGLVVGIAGVQWTGRLLSTLLFHTSGTEAATLAAVAAVLLAVTLIASFLPARRAARIDPVIALRHE